MTRDADLHRALDDFAQSAPTSTAPTIALVEQTQATARRRTRKRIALAMGLTAATILASSVIFKPFWEAKSTTATDPTEPPTSAITSVERYCPDEDRAQGLCPIDMAGEAILHEVQDAFAGKLQPIRLVAADITSNDSTMPPGTRVYTFDAALTTASKGDSPRIRIDYYAPPRATPTSPMLKYHPGFPTNFSSGDGIATITRADGTVIEVRMWGGQDQQDPRMVNSEAVELAVAAVTALSN